MSDPSAIGHSGPDVTMCGFCDDDGVYRWAGTFFDPCPYCDGTRLVAS